MSETQKNTVRIRLRPAAEKAVRAGHPWVFADSIKSEHRTGDIGDLAIVYDRNDRFLAAGLYDPESPISVRIVHAGKPTTIDQEFWQARLDAAFAKRAQLFESDTDGYRVINGENDGYPGLVLDRYADVLVLKVYTIRGCREWACFWNCLRSVMADQESCCDWRGTFSHWRHHNSSCAMVRC